MDEKKGLAEQFESHRPHLRAVAYRMLGSRSEADDAVQESWLHLSRADTSGIENLGGWLTTVVSRVCLGMLRSRTSRHEEPQGAQVPESLMSHQDGSGPETDVLLADSVGLALHVVREKLVPAERVAFVLHDMFSVPFEEIAPIVGRSPAAARQLASRARRRVQGADAVPDVPLTHQRQIVDAFLAASRAGDLDGLLAVLDPEVVLRADSTAMSYGSQSELRGATAVAHNFKGRAQAARPVLVNGDVSAVWAPGGKPRVVIDLTVVNGKIVEINLLADPEHLRQLDLKILED